MNTQTLLSIVADQREELLANDYSELCLRPEESQLDLKSNRAQVVIVSDDVENQHYAKCSLSKRGLTLPM